MAPSSGQKYKVKLASGRILGPIELDRVRLFIMKGHISGVEVARKHPQGEWVDINSIPEIAEMLISDARGSLAVNKEGANSAPASGFSSPGTTRVLESPEATIPLTNDALTAALKKPGAALDGDDERTVVSDVQRYESPLSPDEAEDQDKTAVFEPIVTRSQIGMDGETPSKEMSRGSGISEERTVMLTDSDAKKFWGIREALRDPRKIRGVFENYFQNAKKSIVGTLVTLSVVYIIYTLVFSVGPDPSSETKWAPIRPTLPAFESSKKDPVKSSKYYTDAMKFYLLDTVPGYKRAAELLSLAAKYDSTNVRALALLASSYLNLIDSSNKDENYFSVISKLIELSRAKNVDLPETVIADVEFYIILNKPEAAQTRIVEYTKTQSTFGLEMFYYLALAFYHRGDAQSAVRYVSQYPDNQAFSAKLFYLRGQIAEKLGGDPTAAVQEYEKAIRVNPSHAKSRLAIANLMKRSSDLQSAAVHLDYIVKNPRLLAPRDMARAYYLDSLLHQMYKNDDIALADMERAVKLEKDNHEYLLELYQLRAKSGESVSKVQATARMYYFMGEGEKALKDGKYHEALTQFLQARQANDKSPLPLVKAGDMFLRLNDLGNARLNYKKAAERVPDNIDVWSKYIDVLIQSYEWQEATQAMDKFRRLPVPQSAIDKAAADMYAKQGQHTEAQTFYRKAMARDTIDSTVYIAYAKSLMETKNFKEAPYFFALALRFDPLNVDAIVGTAKCIAATESLERGITMLQDELQKGSSARAELLAAIAEFYIQKGSWVQAQQFVDQALTANPNYPYPWKLQARIHLSRESTERGALEKALDAYESYSSRNASDPSGYLERYRLFVKKGEFERADSELGKIYAIYPKYPNLHFYKGALYSLNGNQKLAIEEYRIELTNNPNSFATLISLGKEYVKAGAPAEAITLFNKAMQIAPKSAEAKTESAYANYLMKNYAGAIALYNAALQIDQGNPLIYKRLGMAYRDYGDRLNAGIAFRKYLEMEPDASDRAEIEMFR